MTYKPTGQKIYFRGLDDPLKVTSITVDQGVLCWMWIEEAYEISSEDDFNMLDESIRGAIPEGSDLFKQITVTFNPWNEHHWLKKRFFDSPDDETLAITTTYKCNEWLDKADLKVFETMKRQNPRRYAVAGLGGWGIVDGLVYENWHEEAFTLEQIRQQYSIDSAFGLDFGYTNDPSALFCGFIDTKNKKIFVYDEMYAAGLSNERIYQNITDMGYAKERITADSAEPKSIDQLKGYGLRIKGADKGKDSINNGIQFIQDYEIIIHPRCVNFLTSAYEGSIYDASASAYLLNDEQVMNTGEDKFSSIAGARPASGSSQNLTRPNIEAMAQNRGTNWHGDLIKQVSAEQMLMIIEMGMMNLQTAIAQGVVSLPWTTGSDTTSSYAAATGSTASLGNGTGRAEKTTTYEGGVAKEYTVDGKTSVCWRGKENFWGNIWKFVYGINIWGNGKMGGGQPYICSDFSFAESKNSGNYEPAGFTVTNANGYISAMGYSTACDWLFIASECLGNSSLPVGDYTYITVNLNGYRITLLGGGWNRGGNAGGFCWILSVGVGYRYRTVGGRLVYIPTRDSATYTAAIEAWKQKMAA